jgi:hypothetical protein
MMPALSLTVRFNAEWVAKCKVLSNPKHQIVESPGSVFVDEQVVCGRNTPSVYHSWFSANSCRPIVLKRAGSGTYWEQSNGKRHVSKMACAARVPYQSR